MHVNKWLAGLVADGLDGLRAGPTGKNGKLPKQRLLDGTQELITPGDCRPQRPLTGGKIPRPSGEKIQPPAELRNDRPQRQGSDTWHDELDR